MKCRIESCDRKHADDQVCCRPHWFALPKPMRDEIWRLYLTDPSSDSHRTAVFDALEYLNAKQALVAASARKAQVQS